MALAVGQGAGLGVAHAHACTRTHTYTLPLPALCQKPPFLCPLLQAARHSALTVAQTHACGATVPIPEQSEKVRQSLCAWCCSPAPAHPWPQGCQS